MFDASEAFIGDLATKNAIAEEDVKSKESWEVLRSKGAKHIFPVYAPEIDLI